MQSKNKIDNIIKRLDALEVSNIKITLDFIRDLEHNSIAFRISAIDRLGAVIEQETFTDIPRPYLDKFYNKYKVSCSGGKTYDLINGELVESKIF
jgi:hypothetical protein